MPKTESSRAENKVKELKKRINKLSPEFKRKLTGDNPMSNLFEGLRATGAAAKTVWNSKKVDSLEKKIEKLEAAKEEARQLKETKKFMSGDPSATELYGKSMALLEKAGFKSAYSRGGFLAAPARPMKKSK